MKACKRPCRACPWRRDADPDAINGLDMVLAEGLRSTSPDDRGMGPEFGAPIFACHESKIGEEMACASWLAQVGDRHPTVRLAVSFGDVEVAQLTPGDDWPALHDTWPDALVAMYERADR